jgi:hypothetical protein
VFTPVQTVAATQTKVAEAPLVINAFDVIGKEWVSDMDGEKIYLLIKDALKQGKKVRLSLKGVKMMNGTFFDEAVCRLYGDFPESTVDNDVEIVDVRKVDSYELRDYKKLRKLYFYDRPEYEALMRFRFERDSMERHPLYDHDAEPEYIPEPEGTDIYALYKQWRQEAQDKMGVL